MILKTDEGTFKNLRVRRKLRFQMQFAKEVHNRLHLSSIQKTSYSGLIVDKF